MLRTSLLTGTLNNTDAALTETAMKEWNHDQHQTCSGVRPSPPTPPPGNTDQFEKEFEELLGEPSESLTTYAMQHALRLTRGNQQDAEDLAQDAYEKILNARFSKPADGRAYITRVLTNGFINVVRRRQTVTRKLGTRTGFEIALDEGVQDHTGGDVAD